MHAHDKQKNIRKQSDIMGKINKLKESDSDIKQVFRANYFLVQLFPSHRFSGAFRSHLHKMIGFSEKRYRREEVF